jgi:thioredoxin-like negative regulator of GroEL
LADQTRARLDQLTDLNRQAMRNPWDADVRRRLAEVCEQIGRPDLAAMWRSAADACAPAMKRNPDG